MPRESSEDSSNQADDPMGSPKCPPDPLGPPRTPWDPLRPPMTPKQVSWPHWTLKIISPAFQIIRRPIKCLSWKYGTSYPSPLIPWDPIGLPLDSLGSCRPTTWVKSWLSGTHQMSLLNLWDILTPLFKKNPHSLQQLIFVTRPYETTNFPIKQMNTQQTISN